MKIGRTLSRGLALALLASAAFALLGGDAEAAGKGQPGDWDRFYHYPYVNYPRNYGAPQQFDSLYYKYPAERRIPVYRTDWAQLLPDEPPLPQRPPLLPRRVLRSG